jgi:hypothetical protein
VWHLRYKPVDHLRIALALPVQALDLLVGFRREPHGTPGPVAHSHAALPPPAGCACLQLRIRAVSEDHELRERMFSGGTFDELIAAVLALPVRNYDTCKYIWQVDVNGPLLLHEAGWTVRDDYL